MLLQLFSNKILLISIILILILLTWGLYWKHNYEKLNIEYVKLREEFIYSEEQNQKLAETNQENMEQYKQLVLSLKEQINIQQKDFIRQLEDAYATCTDYFSSTSVPASSQNVIDGGTSEKRIDARNNRVDMWNSSRLLNE